MNDKRSASVFVKIDDYKDVLEALNIIKSKINEAKDTVNKINEIKNEEDTELDLWSTEIEEIENKVQYIDRSLFEPRM